MKTPQIKAMPGMTPLGMKSKAGERWPYAELKQVYTETLAQRNELLAALKIIQAEMNACKRDFPKDPMKHLGYRFDWGVVMDAIAYTEEGAK